MSLLAKISAAIDAANNGLGEAVSWLTLVMVLAQFTIVMMRYVFGIGAVFMQEAIVYMHATVFIVGAGFTLLHNGHVRVDIFYQPAGPRRKALVDLAGVVFLLTPVCGLIFWTGLPFVSAAWAVFEGSVEDSGIQAVYLLKSLILVYALLLFLQGLSMAAKCLFVLCRAQPGDGAEHQDDHDGMLL